MTSTTKIVSAAALSIALSGCIYIDGDADKHDWESRERNNRQHISALTLDAQRASVQADLGIPDFTEAFTRGEDEFRVLYYRTQRNHHDGDTSKDETTPLVFKNDKLLGWGYETLDEARR